MTIAILTLAVTRHKSKHLIGGLLGHVTWAMAPDWRSARYFEL